MLKLTAVDCCNVLYEHNGILVGSRELPVPFAQKEKKKGCEIIIVDVTHKLCRDMMRKSTKMEMLDSSQ